MKIKRLAFECINTRLFLSRYVRARERGRALAHGPSTRKALRGDIKESTRCGSGKTKGRRKLRGKGQIIRSERVLGKVLPGQFQPTTNFPR